NRNTGDIVDAIIVEITVEEPGVADSRTGCVLPAELRRIEAELFPAQTAADRKRVVEIELDAAHHGIERVVHCLRAIPNLRERELAGVVNVERPVVDERSVAAL